MAHQKLEMEVGDLFTILCAHKLFLAALNSHIFIILSIFIIYSLFVEIGNVICYFLKSIPKNYLKDHKHQDCVQEVLILYFHINENKYMKCTWKPFKWKHVSHSFWTFDISTITFKLKLCILSARQLPRNLLSNTVPNKDSSKLISSPKWLTRFQRDGVCVTLGHHWHIFIKQHHHSSAQIYTYQTYMFLFIGEEQLIVLNKSVSVEHLWTSRLSFLSSSSNFRIFLC